MSFDEAVAGNIYFKLGVAGKMDDALSRFFTIILQLRLSDWHRYVDNTGSQVHFIPTKITPNQHVPSIRNGNGP